MDLADALARRTSCRSFDPSPIEPEVLQRVLSAALSGPTAGNSWALDLVVLEGSQTKTYWDAALDSSKAESFPWPGLLDAPVLVFPVIDRAAYLERYSEPDKASRGLGESEAAWPVPYWWVDAGAAIMAMLLAATDAGLGSLLFGLFERTPVVEKALNVPNDRELGGVIALGKPTREQRKSHSAARKRPAVSEIAHFGSWDGRRDS